MELSWQDAYHQLQAAGNEQQLFEQIAIYAKSLGFEYCCYGIRMPLPVSKPAVAIFDTYPSGWMKHYQESRFLEIDPTVRAGMHSTGLIVWPEAKVDDASRLSARLVKNSTLKVYPGASHGMCTANADEVNADLLAFRKA